MFLYCLLSTLFTQSLMCKGLWREDKQKMVTNYIFAMKTDPVEVALSSVVFMESKLLCDFYLRHPA